MNTTTENYCIDCKQVAASDCESRGHIVGVLGVDMGTPAPQTINPYGDVLCAVCRYPIDTQGLCVMDASHVTPEHVATTEEVGHSPEHFGAVEPWETNTCTHADREWKTCTNNPADVKCDYDYIALATTRKHAAQIVSDHRLAALVPQLEKASTRTTERLKDLPRYLESNGMGTMASIVSDCLEELRVASATAKGATE